jgi:hypothetical protein
MADLDPDVDVFRDEPSSELKIALVLVPVAYTVLLA